MIEHLFFSINDDLEKVAIKIFATLEIEKNISEGDSSNVLEGIYYSVSVFGLTVKLEKNSYDYDDVYNYMMSVKKNILSKVISDSETIKPITQIIIKLLVQNLNLKIAYEKEDGTLEVY